MSLRPFNLRSDTVTRPTAAMRSAMAAADVGDDAHGDCPTVKALEARAAALMGKEAGVFVVSGVMGNLVSIMAHCEQRGSEVIAGSTSHIIIYEGGGVSIVAGALVRSVPNNAADGTMDLAAIEACIRSSDEAGMFPATRCICLENTQCSSGGKVPPLAFGDAVQELASRRGVQVHLDGARIFNAAAALGCSPARVASCADSVTFCLSKGLGAPVGSVVCGTAAFCTRVRRARKLVGGTMHQCGILAAAGLVALADEHIAEQPRRDQANAYQLADRINARAEGTLSGTGEPLPAATWPLLQVTSMPESNIVVVRTHDVIDSGCLVAEMEKRGVLAFPLSLTSIRMVCHLEIEEGDIETIFEATMEAAAAAFELGTRAKAEEGKDGAGAGSAGTGTLGGSYGSWNTN